MSGRAKPRCAHCQRTDQLCGINGVWHCPDHYSIGFARAFAPIRRVLER